jgi:hypothetical protein
MGDAEQAFDDADQLDQLLNDAKAADTVAVSSTADAYAIVNAFANEPSTGGAWSSLDRATVARRLNEIITDPRVVQQGALNLCGPASFFSQWAKRDPAAFATFATDLFDNGWGSIGSLTVAPGQDLLNQNYADMQRRMGASISPAADWMVLGALRNSTDVFWQGSWSGDPNQMLAAMTRPEELANWFSATGIYTNVSCEGNWVSPKGLPHALGLQQRPGVDIALLIHANLMATSRNQPYDRNWLLSQFPNHFVVLLGDVVQNIQTRAVQLTVWTWGEVQTLVVSQDDFVNNYYGAVVARISSN